MAQAFHSNSLQNSHPKKEHKEDHKVTQTSKTDYSDISSYDTNFKVVGNCDTTTGEQYGQLENAYNYFREYLFGNALPAVILTLNRSVKAMGYYQPFAWTDLENHNIPEISINPKISQLPAIEIAQTLVHEMCHLTQHLCGKPSKNGYHNREFSRIMFSVGLMCSNTGMPGGKITGHRMSDYVIVGGLFEEAFKAMPKEFLLPFTSPHVFEKTTISSTSEKKLAEKNKTKYICSKCRAQVWGKPGLKLICGICRTEFIEHNYSQIKSNQ